MADPSPCIGVCVMDPVRNWCLGCFRNREELSRWPSYSDQEKKACYERIKERNL